MEHEKTFKTEVPLATEIIRTLKKIIFALIITNVLTIAGFLWYISLPVEEVTTETVIQESDNTSQNNYVGGDYNGSEADRN